VRQVTILLNQYLTRFSLYCEFSETDIAHYLLPRVNLVYTYVIPDPQTNVVTDFCSFFNLSNYSPDRAEETVMKTAFMYYNV
jgi:glycylpeptide N-tetradecanoyltransferase